MAIYVNTNVGGIRGRNQLNNVNNQLNVTYQRLSSGLRINSAKDDAAGLAISDRMTSQINGLQQGNRNAADAQALLQTAEGAADEIMSNLQQIRTLAVQYSNGTNTAEDKTAIQNQVTELSKGINDIATKTKFGGKKILDGSGDLGTQTKATPTEALSSTITFQIGANGGDTLDFSIGDFTLKGLAVASQATAKVDAVCTAANVVDVNGVDANGLINLTASKDNQGGTATATTLLKEIDDMIGVLDKHRASMGAAQNRLDSTMRNQANVIANQSDARSRIRDTDFAEESAKLSQQNIIQQASMSMLMQANARPQMALSLLG